MTDDKVQTLLHVLSERGLRHWYEVALDWASRFDGWRANYALDDTLSPDDLPLAMLTASVKLLPSAQPVGSSTPAVIDPSIRAQIDFACADAFSSVDFLCWQASRSQSYPTNWNPLIESFLSFTQGGVTVSTWLDTKSRWPREEVRVWLLGKLKEREHMQHLSGLQRDQMLASIASIRSFESLHPDRDKPLS